MFEKGRLRYYSYTRADGINRKKILEKRIENRESWADSRDKKSHEYWKKSNEGKELIPSGQPILTDHPSGKRHRAFLERSQDMMKKSIENSEKAEEHISKMENIKYQLEREQPIDYPECLPILEGLLDEAIKLHSFYKENPEKREHAFSLSYAKNNVNTLTKKLKLANQLWRI